MADVAIICGSASDAAIADKAKKVLDEHKVSWDYQVISAHRDRTTGCLCQNQYLQGIHRHRRPLGSAAGRYRIKNRQTGDRSAGQRDVERPRCPALDRPDAKRCAGRMRGCGQWRQRGPLRDPDPETGKEVRRGNNPTGRIISFSALRWYHADPARPGLDP